MGMTKVGMKLLTQRMAGADISFEQAEIYDRPLSVAEAFDTPDIPEAMAYAAFVGTSDVREGAWVPAVCGAIFRIGNAGVENAFIGQSYALFMEDAHGARQLVAWGNYDIGTVPAAGAGAWSLDVEHAFRMSIDEVRSIVLGVNNKEIDENNRVMLYATDIRVAENGIYLDEALQGKSNTDHTHTGMMRQTLRLDEYSVSTDGWTQNAQGVYEKVIDWAGLKKGADVDMGISGDQIGKVILAGGEVRAEGKLTLVCLAVPEEAFMLSARVVEVV